jgi:hypothetical protein
MTCLIVAGARARLQQIPSLGTTGGAGGVFAPRSLRVGPVAEQTKEFVSLSFNAHTAAADDLTTTASRIRGTSSTNPNCSSIAFA